MRLKKYVLISLALVAQFSYSQSNLELSTIMKGEDFTGHSPENVRWSIDGSTVYFDWNQSNTPGNEQFAYDIKTKKYTSFIGETTLPIYNSSAPKTNVHYYIKAASLARYDTKTKVSTTLISQVESVDRIYYLSNPQTVVYLSNNNLFKYEANNGSIQQLTNFKSGLNPKITLDSTLLEKQQRELFAFVRDQDKKSAWDKAHAIIRKFPKTIYTGDEQLEGLNISKSGEFATFILSTYPKETTTYVEDYITGSGFTQRIPARAKVGEQDPSHRMGIFSIVKDTVIFVNFSQLPDIRKKPSYRAEYNDTTAYKEDRKFSIHEAVMHPTENKALVDIRSYDNKDRWIICVDLATGKWLLVDHQYDEAWIGGPGISGWNEEVAVLDWLSTDEVYFQSEKTGYSHLYKYQLTTKVLTPLTSGKFEVHDVQLSTDKQSFYLITNQLHPGVRNGYLLDIKTKALKPLVVGEKGISWTLSPDEKWMVLRESTTQNPWKLTLASTSNPTVTITICDPIRPDFKAMKLIQPQLKSIPTSDGKEVMSRLYIPEKPNGAAVLFVHGAGYLQNAHHYWSSYYREFLFHQLLTSKGYTVIDVDYRASEGYGRDTRTAIYRHMGERDLLDYVDAKKFLVENYKIDANRVGIYGGSYGGFISIMAMLKTPGTFACAAALRSVTDWQHYNHEYTNNILNSPAMDPIAYKRSSPIYYAEALNGPLLLLHGVRDDNVQFQDVVRLNQRFIELGKKSFDMAIYPTESHGFKTTVAWTDEYSRILKLMETYLNK